MHQFIMIFLILSIVSFNFLFAQNNTHLYEKNRGVILYDIYGSGQLTKETNLTIKGKARLRFKDWGNVKVEEEHGTILTTGSIKHQQTVRRFEKQDKDNIITVDYENEQLLERPLLNTSDTHLDETKDLEEKGKDTILGLTCDVWVGKGVKKCLYNKLVLKLEVNVMNIGYVKIASKIIWDINTSSDECTTPNFPLQKFSLLNNIKTKTINKVDNLCKILKNKNGNFYDTNSSINIVNIDNPKRKKFINYIGQDIYEQQVQLLPELLMSMKHARECLQISTNTFEANQCIEDFSRMKESFGTNEDYFIIVWDDEKKNTLLDKIEDQLIDLQSRMPCVNRARNITDLSTCLK